jgi:hypothetical protein
LIFQAILRQFVTIFADAALELGFVDIDAIVRVHKGIALGALGRNMVEQLLLFLIERSVMKCLRNGSLGLHGAI